MSFPQNLQVGVVGFVFGVGEGWAVVQAKYGSASL